MGWYYTHGASRADIIREITEPQASGLVTVRKFTSGNTLWTVHDGPSGRWLGCYLLSRSRDGWGYKPMEESMGPYYYSCPLAFLAEAPIACPEWRDGVRKYHAERNARLALRRERRRMGATY